MLARILRKRHNIDCDVVDPRGWVLRGVPSRAEEYRADMASYYDVVIGLHPDNALREVVNSAQVRPVIVVPCCNFWSDTAKLGRDQLLDAIENHHAGYGTSERAVLDFRGPHNRALVLLPGYAPTRHQAREIPATERQHVHPARQSAQRPVQQDAQRGQGRAEPVPRKQQHRPGVPGQALALASRRQPAPPDARWQALIPAEGTGIIAHHDLAPWNLVISPRQWAFIDWDTAAPGSRLWDLAYALHGFVPLSANPAYQRGNPAHRMRLFAGAYRLDQTQRQQLVPMLARRTKAIYDCLAGQAAAGTQPWTRLWQQGHGRAWRADTGYIAGRKDTWHHALLG